MNMAQGTETIAASESATGNPPALPSHVKPIGEHHRFSAYWWIGCACAAPEELRSLQSIVIYNKTACLFLAEDEARKAFRMGCLLLAQFAGERKGS